MSLIEAAKRDIKAITTQLTEFAVNMTLIDLEGNEYAVKGVYSKHHIKVDSEGNAMIGKNASFSISEYVLIDLDYPYRNDKGEVYLKNHELIVKDSTGLEKHHVIDQWLPDETIGLIVCILKDLGTS
jgi:hypothetical protein